MFTIGIFTTHIPYIAFAVFYAFFLLFGVNKASSGEIDWGENNIVFKAQAVDIFSEADTANFSNFHYSQGAGLFSPGTCFFADKKNISYTSFFPENIRKCYYSQALFNRPPPVLS
ncbi:hypothetical protein SAMN05444274_10949 [Mariniphaga anaerophila]|uniref:Uncharacterized protein n=1 Tax=Mariniphaga anaerophila TaxID=1484053 RepID=A0A1M5EI94_9BACT|nr:hypothetical protein [Mariniphaga anaerophila]SHF78988.1 hypothetical protein SAMN05444274_10949 [Mariniphaga anaerophila]